MSSIGIAVQIPRTRRRDINDIPEFCMDSYNMQAHAHKSLKFIGAGKVPSFAASIPRAIRIM